MKFLTSPDQEEIQDTVQRVVTDSLGDRGLNEIINGDRSREALLTKRLAELGTYGLTIGEEYGGQGLGLTDIALVAEILGYTAAPGAHVAHVLATIAISLGGDDEQRRTWLPKLASGERTATVAFGEPGGRWLPEQWTLPATPKLTGSKSYVIDQGPTDLVVVGLADGELGVVEVSGGNVTRTPLSGVDLTRTISTLEFEGADVALLSHGRAVADRVVDAGLVLTAADAYGCGRRAVEMAVGYSKQREQFGVKIAEFQALRHQLANMVLDVEPCRGLYWQAAHTWDTQDPDARHMAALAKSHIPDVCLRVSRDMIEAHGGIGFTWEFDAHIWLKRAMFDFSWLGTPYAHRARVVDLAPWGGPVGADREAGNVADL